MKNIYRLFWFLIPTLAFFAVEGGDSPGADKADSESDDSHATANGGGAGNDEPKLSQTDVDKIVGGAKRSAKNQATKELLQMLGVESVESLQATLKQAEQAELDKLSDLEKLQKQVDEMSKAKIEAEQAAQVAIDQARQTLLEAAIITAAQGFNDPADAVQFVDRSMIETTDDGQFKNIDKAIEKLVESKPYLLKGTESKEPARGTPDRNRAPRRTPPTPPTESTSRRPTVRI